MAYILAPAPQSPWIHSSSKLQKLATHYFEEQIPKKFPVTDQNQYLLLLHHHLNPLAIFTFTIFTNHQEHHTKIQKNTFLSHHHSKIFSSPYPSIFLRKFSESCQIISRILNPFHRPVLVGQLGPASQVISYVEVYKPYVSATIT